jgi:hypothetical protein
MRVFAPGFPEMRVRGSGINRANQTIRPPFERESKTKYTVENRPGSADGMSVMILKLTDRQRHLKAHFHLASRASSSNSLERADLFRFHAVDSWTNR